MQRVVHARLGHQDDATPAPCGCGPRPRTTSVTRDMWPSSGCGSAEGCARSYRWTSPNLSATTRCVPARLNAIDDGRLGAWLRRRRRVPQVSGCQRRPTTTVLPCAAARTHNVATGAQSLVRHTRSVLSSDDAAACAPSLLTALARMRSVGPFWIARGASAVPRAMVLATSVAVLNTRAQRGASERASERAVSER